MPDLFPLGSLVITRGALDVLHRPDVDASLMRHRAGDWGDLCAEDVEANKAALAQGLRVLSVYHDRSGTKFWIITEADRSVTTILLPEEY
mgnify:CR=1 FL=1